MQYYLDKDTLKIKRDNRIDINKAYRELIFNTMKLAYEFREYIYNTELENYGVINCNSDVIYYNNLKEYKEKMKTRISEKLAVLANNCDRYKDGLFNTVEWEAREKLNKEYLMLLNIWNFKTIEARESIHRAVYKAHNGRFYGNSDSEIALCLYRGIYRANYNIPEVKEISEKWRGETEELDEQITNITSQYITLDNRTKIEDKVVNNYKNSIIRDLENLNKCNQDINVTLIKILVDIPGQTKLHIKQLRDLEIEDIIINRDGYNLYFINEDANNKVTKINFIYQVNERLGITDTNNWLLRNDDWIIIDTESQGDKLSIQGLETKYPFYTDKEIIAYKPKIRGFDISDKAKNFYDIDNRNIEYRDRDEVDVVNESPPKGGNLLCSQV